MDALIDSTAWPDDPDYVAALRLFVGEEHTHAQQLARLIARLGGTLITEHWTDRCFRTVRHALGAGFGVQVLLTAELVGTAYYRLLRSTGDTLLGRSARAWFVTRRPTSAFTAGGS